MLKHFVNQDLHIVDQSTGQFSVKWTKPWRLPETGSWVTKLQITSGSLHYGLTIFGTEEQVKEISK